MTERISIQGDAASFHDIAARQYFGDDYEPVFCSTFVDTIAALKKLDSDFALCALENSLYGSINEVYDLILKNNCYIVGEVYLRIGQCLIGLPGSRVEDVASVYSHPVALAQCEDYLDENLAEADRHVYHDTAASVKYIMEQNDSTIAAIASREAAALYDAPILAPSIETNKENYTRFVVLSLSRDEPVANANKTSLMIETGHGPGALHEALGVFAVRGINLTKLQSRPIVGKAWHYMFYVDVEAGVIDESCIQALSELATQGTSITVLGSYRNGLDATN